MYEISFHHIRNISAFSKSFNEYNIYWLLKHLYCYINDLNWKLRNQFINTLKWNSDWIQLRLKSDNLVIVAAEIERMSSEDQDKKNMLLNMNAMWLMNTVRNNETQKIFSKMIQNFENLFHQKLMKIERADNRLINNLTELIWN